MLIYKAIYMLFLGGIMITNALGMSSNNISAMFTISISQEKQPPALDDQPPIGKKTATPTPPLILPSASPTTSPIAKTKPKMEDARLVIFACTQDSPPISETNGLSNLTGFCNELLKHLKSKQYKIDNIKILEHAQRFKGFSDLPIGKDVAAQKVLAVECGANTITLRRRGDLETKHYGEFSEPFFETSTKLLIKQDKLGSLKLGGSGLKIGVLDGINSTDVIRQIFPDAFIHPRPQKKKILDELASGDLDAYASDEVLLDAILRNSSAFSLKKEDYVIEPRLYGYTTEAYGVVVYNTVDHNGNPLKDGKALLDNINKWIRDNGTKSLEQYKTREWNTASVNELLAKEVEYDRFVRWRIPLVAIFSLGMVSLLIVAMAVIAVYKKRPRRKSGGTGKKDKTDPSGAKMKGGFQVYEGNAANTTPPSEINDSKAGRYEDDFLKAFFSELGKLLATQIDKVWSLVSK